jgi:hypothetical protein
MKRGGWIFVTLVVACTARNPAYQVGAGSSHADGEAEEPDASTIITPPADAIAADAAAPKDAQPSPADASPTLNPDLPPAAPPDAGPSTGLTGFYFNDNTLTALKFQRLDPVVDFAWANDPPDPGITFLGFSVRWTGKIRTLYTERYTFTVHSGDGARLWIDGDLLIDDWKNRAPEDSVDSVDLGSGLHDIKLEYLHNTGWSVVRLLWESRSQSKGVVPTQYLTPN